MCRAGWRNFLSGRRTHSVKAETHDATNRCDTSPRQVAATNRLVWHVKIIVAAICRTNSNWFEFVRHVAATKQGQATCRSNSADEATCRSDVSQRFVALCVSAFRPRSGKTCETTTSKNHANHRASLVFSYFGGPATVWTWNTHIVKLAVYHYSTNTLL